MTAPFDDEPEFPSRDENMQPLCPNCGAVISQVETADYCACGYVETYP